MTIKNLGMMSRGSSSEARGMASPYPEHELKEIVPCSECDQEERGDVEVQMEEEEKEERGRKLSSPDDTPLAMRVVKSLGGSHIPGVRGEPEGPSYAGSGQERVHSEGGSSWEVILSSL